MRRSKGCTPCVLAPYVLDEGGIVISCWYLSPGLIIDGSIRRWVLVSRRLLTEQFAATAFGTQNKQRVFSLISYVGVTRPCLEPLSIPNLGRLVDQLALVCAGGQENHPPGFWHCLVELQVIRAKALKESDGLSRYSITRRQIEVPLVFFCETN